jgi:hypothetical protein
MILKIMNMTLLRHEKLSKAKFHRQKCRNYNRGNALRLLFLTFSMRAEPALSPSFGLHNNISVRPRYNLQNEELP